MFLKLLSQPIDCIKKRLCYVGGQFIEDNQYELKLTAPTAYSSLAIHVFVFKYQMVHIEK